VPGGTHHLSLSHLYPYWSRARTTAGRPDLCWHDLRHSGAVLAAATGASLADWWPASGIPPRPRRCDTNTSRRAGTARSRRCWASWPTR